VTTGIVSAVAREIKAPNGFSISNVIQTDASVNPGNSGGPLMDADGRVIGINSQIATGGGSGSVGIAFAIPINTAKRLLPQLRQGGKIERAYLGIVMAPVSADIARDLNLPTSEGALITCVEDGGPGGRAGLRGGRTGTSTGIAAGGDLIVGVDGRKVTSPSEVSAAIADDKPDETVEVTYYRGNDRRTTRVKLGVRPSNLDASNCASETTTP
jgi:S1-C subfamily serine protease